jgi:diguanylate cyclase (GGDEF)-like protein
MTPRALRTLLVALLAVTIVALLWNEFGMDTVLTIDAGSPYAIVALDDRMPDGGRSVATVSRENRRLALDCEIAAGYEWPFCEMLVQFRPAPRGIDLSRYDAVRLWITATGPEAQQRVRLIFRNFDPAYARPGTPQSQKVMELSYEPALYPQGYEVPLARFTVAGWWIEEHPLTLELEAPDFRNVTSIAVATDGRTAPGMHRIRVDRIELRGKVVAPAAFRLAIIGAWMACVVAWLLIDAAVARRALRLSAASQHSLQRLNESLRLETRSLARMARTDPLTGVLNRKGLADELLRLARLGGESIFPLTLVFIDIDHFRRVNDGWGHELGDQVIRGLATLVRAAVQRDDLFARWGGEEFILVFRDMPALEARAVAERLRERISHHEWPEELKVTCSFGVAEWHGGEDLNEGVRRADEAMYRAKQNGRNRVEVQLGSAPAAPSAPDTEPA